MSKIRVKYMLLILFLIFTVRIAPAQSSQLNIMFYNVENFFYPENDSLLDADDDFTPAGVRKWTWNRYHKKTAQLCKVILGINGWDPPDLVCLCEIENREVLENIINHPLLLNYQYKIIHRDSPDHRGIDVGMIYRESKLVCTDKNWIRINNNGQLQHTREILAAEFAVFGNGRTTDTLVCFMNHWSSKYGGAIESQPKRMKQASTLLDSIQSITRRHPGWFIIAGGDFNESTGAPACSILTDKGSLLEILPSPEKGTYKYQGRWDCIDHVFVTDQEYQVRLVIWQHPFLLEPDEKYTGSKPRRTYAGYAYNGGLSDHLPLLLKVEDR